MSSAANHSKRSHRSNRKHYGQGRTLRQQNAVRHFERTTALGSMFRRLRAKILPQPQRVGNIPQPAAPAAPFRQGGL